jgi:predicted PhzF superfamily epimerase YddE/YHI9
MKIEVDGQKLLAVEKGRYVRGVVLTLAPEKSSGFDPKVDYYLRYFAPWNGINEDPATGSAQCGVAPFWSKLLKKTHFKGKELLKSSFNNLFLAYQAFPTRGAELEVDLDDKNKRLKIYGRALTIFSGHFSSKLVQK